MKLRHPILLLLLCLFVACTAHSATLTASGATTVKRHDALPLHVGSSGQNVCKLKYLLRDPRPKQNVFRKVKGLYKGPMCSTDIEAGYLGKPFGKTIHGYKFRLGYPDRYNHKSHPVAGAYFFKLLRGEKRQTKEMVALAQRRLRTVESGISPLALKLKLLAVSQLGVTEHPWNSNSGPRISYPWPRNGYPSYQSSTGQYHAAWCASFIQWLLQRVGYGTIANRSAGVLYIEGWARYHGLLFAPAHVGSLVAYLDDGGHIGLVTRVTAAGYVEISGNTSNSVRETWHPWNYRLRVFINLKGI